MKKLKKFKIIFALVVVIAMSTATFSGCASNKGSSTGNTNKVQSISPAAKTDSISPTVKADSSSTPQQVSGKDTDGDGIPDTVEKTYGTNPYSADTDGDGVPDKIDKDPLYTPNLIKEASTAPLNLKIKDARVEDNINAKDHLEITLTNTDKTDLKNFDMYFTATDTVTNVKEGYYVKLVGFTLEAGATKTLHFDNKNGDLTEVIKPIPSAVMDIIQQDNKKGDLHYNGNPNGIYGTSKNEVLFQGQIHASGFAPMEFSAKKSTGTAELAD